LQSLLDDTDNTHFPKCKDISFGKSFPHYIYHTILNCINCIVKEIWHGSLYI